MLSRRRGVPSMRNTGSSAVFVAWDAQGCAAETNLSTQDATLDLMFRSLRAGACTPLRPAAVGTSCVAAAARRMGLTRAMQPARMSLVTGSARMLRMAAMVLWCALLHNKLPEQSVTLHVSSATTQYAEADFTARSRRQSKAGSVQAPDGSTVWQFAANLGSRVQMLRNAGSRSLTVLAAGGRREARAAGHQ